MSKDKNKPPRRNPFLDDDRESLLDDLDSIKSLLGDSDSRSKETTPRESPEKQQRPGPHDDIPMLLPDEDDGKAAEGDSHTQASLFDQTPGKTPARPATDPTSNLDRQSRLTRDNPFLPRKSMDDLAAERERISQVTHGQTPAQPASPTTPKAGNPDQASQPSPEQIRAMVDEVLAEWLPKLERELRDRLTLWFSEKR